MVNEEFDDSNPYNEGVREEALDNGEIDSAEEGFLKGYDDDSLSEDDVDEDDDEELRD